MPKDSDSDFSFTGVAALRLTDDTASEADRDTLAPLPLPAPSPWGGMGSGAGGSSSSASTSGGVPHIPYYPTGYAPMSYSYSSDPLGGATLPSTFSYGGREGSVHSGSGKRVHFLPNDDEGADARSFLAYCSL